MAKTCDLRYIQGHWRGFSKGKTYPVLSYWQGNGSAYRGSHSPVCVAANYRTSITTIGGIPFEGGNVAADSFMSQIRKTMDNVPTPHIFLSKFADAAIYSRYADSDLGWLAERERFVDTYEQGTEIVAVPSPSGKRTPNALFVLKHAEEEGTVMHSTPKGSTVAVSEDGEIGCLRANKKDTYTERTLLEKATSAGGYKTIAYEQDHEFYMRAGFVPVAWVHTEEKDYPDGFDLSKDFSCDQIVYLHATKCDPEDVKMAHDLTLDEWKKAVKPSKNIEYAENRRDDYAAGKKKIRYADAATDEKKERRARRRADHKERWVRPNLDTILMIKRKKTKKADLPDTSNWSDWEQSAADMDDYEW